MPGLPSSWGVIAMRRLGVIVALGALLGMFGGLVTAAPALARGPGWEVVPADSFTLPADYCGFEIGLSFPVDREYSKILKAADGSMIILTTGALTVSATNPSNGKTATSNLSGPAKVTTFPDGSVTVTEEGYAGFVFSPEEAQRFGMPTLGVTVGLQTTSFDADGNLTAFSLQGRVVIDTCAALS
jgi:streptogramin lyase